MAASAVTVDAVYTTPMEHNNPHGAARVVACWADDAADAVGLDAGRALGPQGGRRRALRARAGAGPGHLPARRRWVRQQGPPHANLSSPCWPPAHLPGRAVKLALTRQQMFALVGYRTPDHPAGPARPPTPAAADRDRVDVVEHDPRIKEFAEQTAAATRAMYAAPNRRADAPPRGAGRAGAVVDAGARRVPRHVRPRGRDRRAGRRVRRRPGRAADPQRARRSTRHRQAVLQPQPRRLPARTGARALRVGRPRNAPPGARRDGDWLVGTGVAASTYPTYRMPGSTATVRLRPTGATGVEIGAADLGTGTWTC